MSTKTPGMYGTETKWYAPSGTFYENGEVKNFNDIPNIDLMGTPYWNWQSLETGEMKLIFTEHPHPNQYTWRAPSGTLYRREQIMWYISVPLEDNTTDTEWQWIDYGGPNSNKIQLKYIPGVSSKSSENPNHISPPSTDPDTDPDTQIELELIIMATPGLRF